MSTDSFVAIDVETANADLASICQIGLVTFADGQIVSEWQSLIDPEDEFNEINISIHGTGLPKSLSSVAFSFNTTDESSV